MNRADFQKLADERLADASALLRASQWSGAYYLAGYALECGLKACIAKSVNRFDFPDKELAVKAFTHEIEALVKVAGLIPERDRATKANPALGKNWLLVKNWNERARYAHWTQVEAQVLFSAISDAQDGVLPWIKCHW